MEQNSRKLVEEMTVKALLRHSQLASNGLQQSIFQLMNEQDNAAFYASGKDKTRSPYACPASGQLNRASPDIDEVG